MKSESKIIQNTSTTITMHTTNKNNYITLKEHMSKQETKQKDDNAIYLVATKAQAKPIRQNHNHKEAGEGGTWGDRRKPKKDE